MPEPAAPRPMVAREGREQQRYTPDGSRIVAGTVVVNTARTEVLLVSSEAHPKRWVLPKGGAESDETIEESAMRETWEEAGATGHIIASLGTFIDPKPPKNWSGDPDNAPPATQFYFFELALDKLADDWPEKHKRRRKWMSFEEAHDALVAAKRPQLADALKVAWQRESSCDQKRQAS